MDYNKNIQKQVGNKDTIAKYLEGNGVGQDYTPIFNITSLGKELTDNLTIRLAAKELGYNIIVGSDDIKMVYQEMNCTTNYNADCFTDMHNKIRDDYKSFLTTVTDYAQDNHLITPMQAEHLKKQIDLSQKTVQRQDNKAKIRVNAR